MANEAMDTGTVMEKPLLYITRGGIDDEHVPGFRAWYRKHGASLLVQGFWSARQYTSNRRKRWSNVYEIGDISIFKSKSYVESANADPSRKTSISRFFDLSVTVYDQLAVMNPHGGEIDVYPTLSGPSIAFIRFDWSGDEDSLLERARTAVAKELAAFPVRTARLCRQKGSHPEFGSTDPLYCIAAELSRASDTSLDAALHATMTNAFAEGSRTDVETLTKFYGVMCEDYFK